MLFVDVSHWFLKGLKFFDAPRSIGFECPWLTLHSLSRPRSRVKWKTLPCQQTQSLKKLKARDKRIADLQAAVEEASASAPSSDASATVQQQLEAAAARAEALEAKL